MFGAIKLTKSADCDKYGYNGFVNGFYARLQFSWVDGSWCKNFVIFGVDKSSSLHLHNRKKDILVLGDSTT